MESNEIVTIQHLSHRYAADRLALDDLSCTVRKGEIFGLLGPNGSGKTTLFRLLATLLSVQAGRVVVAGHDLRSEQSAVRAALGIVFQSPSLDKKLTVAENLKHQGHLYGLRGAVLRERSAELLARLHLTERAGEAAENLSGGLQRRVEIAKALLHRPALLLLDEPSTGLDPGVRRDLWRLLRDLQREQGVTVILTTHLMDEAEQCDRLLILDQGRKITLDTPVALRAQVSGTVITAQTKTPEALRERVREHLGQTPRVVEGALRLEWQPHENAGSAADWVGRLMQEFGSEVSAVTLSQPTLEDVFIQKTGHYFTAPETEKS